MAHQLIKHCLQHYHVPTNEIDYIMNLYSMLEGKVVTKGWESNRFRFSNGIFTGDNYSPIIFNVVFQPLIDYIQQFKEKLGYNLGNTKVITKPFADDFEIITNQKNQHQKLQDDIQKKATSMGFTFKPSKCRSLSLSRGKPDPHQFTLTDPSSGEKVKLRTLEDDPHKFLGCTMTYHNTPKDHLDFLKGKLSSKLENIEKLVVRAEYKVAVYARYALPSLRYHLTVHSVHKTHLEELDLLAMKHLKRWLGIPSKGSTSLGISSPLLLSVKPVSQVYMEGHLGAYINSMLVADADTKEALRCAEEREGEWVNRSSTIRECKAIFEEMQNETECFIPTPENTNTFAATVRVEKPKIMAVAKKKVCETFKRRSAEAAALRGFQGQMLTLLAEEEQDISWKSTIYRVPRGVMAWAVRASTNTLATPDNLARWGKQVDTTCSMVGCTSPCNLGHLLSCCSKSLDRYKYRHDSVLTHLLDTIQRCKKDGVQVYADLNGWRVNGGTVPAELVLTDQIPDLVIIDRSVNPTKVMLVELTVPWDSANTLKAAFERKTARYERLEEDLRLEGYSASNLPLEVGCRGVVSSRNLGVLATICSTVGIRTHKQLRANLGRIALLGSYRIWLARRSQDWAPGDLIRAN